jgi:uncharacterized protein YjbI with pentapeptide repeats
MRNQNIYSSRITEGLAVFSPQNSKPLSPTLQRAFVVVVQNLTNSARRFRLTIANQPAAGVASFLQAQGVLPTTTLEVAVAAHAGIARPVFAVSNNPTNSITVNADEIVFPGTPALSGFVVLNPDGTVPPLIDPDGAPGGIAAAELYNPDLANPDLANPNALKTALANPDLANPDLANPDLANPDLANPDLANPDLANVNILNPDLANPDMANAIVSDATYVLTNKGNTTASYRIRLVGTSPADAKLQLVLSKRYLTPVSYNCALVQEGQNTVHANVLNPPVTSPSDLTNPDLANPDLANATISLQPTETARVTVRGNVNLTRMAQIITGLAPVAVAHAANTGATTPQISAPLLITTAQLPDAVVGVPYEAALAAIGGTPPYAFGVMQDMPSGLSFSSGTLFGTPRFPNLVDRSSGTAIAFSVSDSAARQASRILQLRIANRLASSTTALPAAISGTPYSFTMAATGGIAPYQWSGVGLPAWLSLSPAGTLSGTPPAAGTFTLTAQVIDSASPAQAFSQALTLTVFPPTG